MRSWFDVMVFARIHRLRICLVGALVNGHGLVMSNSLCATVVCESLSVTFPTDLPRVLKLFDLQSVCVVFLSRYYPLAVVRLSIMVLGAACSQFFACGPVEGRPGSLLLPLPKLMRWLSSFARVCQHSRQLCQASDEPKFWTVAEVLEGVVDGAAGL